MLSLPPRQPVPMRAMLQVSSVNKTSYKNDTVLNIFIATFIFKKYIQYVDFCIDNF